VHSAKYFAPGGYLASQCSNGAINTVNPVIEPAVNASPARWAESTARASSGAARACESRTTGAAVEPLSAALLLAPPRLNVPWP